MSNYINYAQHVLNAPAEIYRHFAYDVALTDEEKDEDVEGKDKLVQKVKRFAVSILPLVSLYHPIGKTLSVSLSGIRLVTNASQMISSSDKDRKVFYTSMMQCTLSVVALAGTIFSYKICLLVTNVSDVVHNAADLGQDIKDKKNEKLLKDILQLAAAISFTATLCIGSLEVVLASYLIQVLLNAWLARQDIKDDHYIEACTKIAMGLVRGYQANQMYQSIQRRNELLNNDVLKQLLASVKKAKEAHQLLNHHLAGDLEGTIENDEGQLEDINGEKYSTGSHYHGYGKGLVKGMNIALKTRVIEGREVIEIDFKISHVHRDRLEKLLTQMKDTPDAQIQELLSLTNSQAKAINIDTDPIGQDDFWWGWDDLRADHHIGIKGLGQMVIGANNQHIGSYNHVLIRMDHDKNLFDLYEILSLFDLEAALMDSATDDIERLKLGHLYHTLFPREAYKLERDELYFELPVAELRQEMIKRAPSSAGMFDRYLDQMQLQEILPGKQRYTIPGLGRDVHAAGGRVLVTTLMTSWDSKKEDSLERVGSILKMGMLSLETRKQMGMTQKGLNGDFSDFVGGSDSIFTQLIPKSVLEENMPMDELEYAWFAENPIIFLIDLDKAVETGTYQYHDDDFGTRQGDSDFWWWGEAPYPNRDGILDFSRRENQDFSESNEVMIKERVTPEMITGIVVQEESIKQQMIAYLTQKNMIQDGIIFGMEVDKFIHVTDRFSEDLVTGS